MALAKSETGLNSEPTGDISLLVLQVLIFFGFTRLIGVTLKVVYLALQTRDLKSETTAGILAFRASSRYPTSPHYSTLAALFIVFAYRRRSVLASFTRAVAAKREIVKTECGMWRR